MILGDISAYSLLSPKIILNLKVKISVISVISLILSQTKPALYFIPRIHCRISSTPSVCTTVRASSGIAVPGSTLFIR